MPPTAPGPRHGILILGSAAFFFSLFALTGKAVSPGISSAQMILVRAALLVPVMGLWARQQGHPLLGHRKGLLFLRGFLGSISLFAFYMALKRLPLADTVLIFQAHPLVVALIAPLLLKEKNGPSQWGLIILSFIGVAVVVGPTGVGAWEGRAAALVCCVLSALVYVLVRMLHRTEKTLTIAFSFPAVSLALFGPCFLLRLPGFEWSAPGATDWILLLFMALFAACGQVLLTLGLGRVPAAKGTAISNLQVAFALFYGMVFFHEIPGWITLCGAGLIVSSQILLALTRVPVRSP